MGTLALRNLKVFFRDRAAVIMSFFSAFVMIALYALFLGDLLASSDLPDSDKIVTSWLIAGLIATESMTGTLGALGTMVDDRASGIERDFLVSPLRRSALAGGYALSAFVIGMILSLVILVLGEIYIVASGGEVLAWDKMLQVIFGIMLSVASSGAIVFFITSLLRTLNAYSTVSLIIGVLIGFVSGIYIPIGQLSDEIGMVIKVFPVSYSASYFRILMTEAPINTALAGAPEEMGRELRETLGVYYNFDGTLTDMTTAVIVMVITAVVFFVLTWMQFSLRRKSNT